MVYAAYVDGSTEFYDLSADPNQLQNLSGDTSSIRANQSSTLRSQALALSTCTGTGCHDLEFH
jgi:hypothetical protein